MFNNLNEHSIWEMATKAVQVQDSGTAQMVYDGEYRGQTQRYMITAGRLVKDLFDDIELAFSYNDFATSPVANLKYLQRKINAGFLHAEDPDPTIEPKVRHMLEEIQNAWKLKGTAAFMHWIIWLVFGWRVLGSYASSSIFHWNESISLTYYYGVSRPRLRRIYDPAVSGIGGMVVIEIDVFHDPQFVAKVELLEALKDDWFVPATFSYVNFT
jgi:hypothetical protein